MPDKITFMGIEIGEVCARCNGVGANCFMETCPDCGGIGFWKKVGTYDALESFAHGLAWHINSLTLTKKTLLARIEEFEQAVGYHDNQYLPAGELRCPRCGGVLSDDRIDSSPCDFYCPLCGIMWEAAAQYRFPKEPQK